MGAITTADLVSRLAVRAYQYGQNVTAKELEISPQYLSDILNFHRTMSKSVAWRMGYVPELRWRKKTEASKLAFGGSPQELGK